MFACLWRCNHLLLSKSCTTSKRLKDFEEQIRTKEYFYFWIPLLCIPQFISPIALMKVRLLPHNPLILLWDSLFTFLMWWAHTTTATVFVSCSWSLSHLFFFAWQHYYCSSEFYQHMFQLIGAVFRKWLRFDTDRMSLFNFLCREEHLYVHAWQTPCGWVGGPCTCLLCQCNNIVVLVLQLGIWLHVCVCVFCSSTHVRVQFQETF